uniref:RIKEN cDNA 4931400O07 gene n=1 Tax=Mus spicilegus TaxID=10103 RepID=A0A8C6GHD7_MUSSI
MAVSKEQDIREEILGFTSQSLSEFNCDDVLRTSRNKGGRNIRSQKKRSHGCPRKSKGNKKVWKVVTRIKSVLEDSFEKEKEEKKHIIMVFYCHSNEERKSQKKENAEGYEEFLIPNDAIVSPGSGPVAECPASSPQN